MPSIELLGRLLYIQENHILLAKATNESHTFLPGGHVEFNEGAIKAIIREIDEELGDKALVEEFICAIEHSYLEDGAVHNEIALVFSGSMKNSRFPQNPVSREEQLEFFWHPIDRLNEANLLPEPLRDVIYRQARAKPHDFWISTLDSDDEKR